MCDCRCRAPISGTDRCPNSILSWHHCAKHCTKAKKLYNKYKALSAQAYSLDLDKVFPTIQERITYLLSCYAAFMKAYDSRMEYKKYALVPEFWDWGHEMQFKIFQQKIDNCELILQDIYESIKPVIKTTSEKSDKSEDTKDSPIIEETNMLSVVKNFKQKQKRDTEAENNEINAYIRANQQYNKKKNKVVKRLAESLDKLMEGKSTDNNTLILILFIKVLVSLINIGYLQSDYKPELCKKCACGTYVYQRIKNHCKCVLQYTQIDKFLSELSFDALVILADCFNKKSSSLMSPILDDLIGLFRIWGDNLLIGYGAILQWNVDKNRLILEMESQ